MKISDSFFPNHTAKDAIVDRFRDKTGGRPYSGGERLFSIRCAGAATFTHIKDFRRQTWKEMRKVTRRC